MIVGARVGILGGTFDPVHVGHVESARLVHRLFALERTLLVPSGTPPHRHRPSVSRFHRFAMTALAVTGIAGLEVSDLEIGDHAPSFTSSTLEKLHGEGLVPAQIFFITGADAFAEIATWHRYPEVLDLAHFVVVSRSGFPAHSLAARLPELAPRMRGVDSDGGRSPDHEAEPRIHLVDESTPIVSSTDIRRRLEAGDSIAGLVPEPVRAYIDQHHLYIPAAEQVSGKPLA
jgi:nicotinate-nucleotide adenylyltransferase